MTDFTEKVLIVMLTAALSSFLIPIIVTRIQRRRSTNEAIVQAKVKLLDELTNTILLHESLLLEISYFGSYMDIPEFRKKAFDKYNDRAPDSIAKWRSLIVKSTNLASEKVSLQLREFMKDMFWKQDGPIAELFKIETPSDRWKEQHAINVSMIEKAEQLISNLAKDLKLTKSDFR